MNDNNNKKFSLFNFSCFKHLFYNRIPDQLSTDNTIYPKELRYHIQRGDTVESVAKKLLFTKEELKVHAYNCFSKCSYEHDGRLMEFDILIPGKFFTIPRS